MIPYLNKILTGLLVIALAALTVQSIRLDNAQDKYVAFQSASKDLLIDAYKDVNKKETAAELAQSKLDVEYQRGKRDATQLSKDVAADLSADNERLQKQWRAALRRATTAEATAANSGRDGEADELRRDVEDVVRRAAEADARIVRLQDRIDGYLKQINGKGWYDSNGRGRYGSSLYESGFYAWDYDRLEYDPAIVAQSFGSGEGTGPPAADERGPSSIASLP